MTPRLKPADHLYVARVGGPSRVLGPGLRTIVWVWGCSRRCRGCIAEPILGQPEVAPVPVEEVAAHILADPTIEGVTFSGGEPFEQAPALGALCARLRASRNLSLMSYTGFTLAEIERHADLAHRAFLDHLDILVDGPFVESRQADLLWRGSANQRIHLLTARHADLAGLLGDAGAAGLEVTVHADGRVSWIGVPPPAFEQRLADGLRRRGVRLLAARRFWT